MVLLECKGQSAIEYLMTYGWMLLVVAVVGGAIFSTVNQQSLEVSSGFGGSDVMIDNFGSTSNENLQVELRNGTSESIEINEIRVSDGENTAINYPNDEISVAETNVVTLGGVNIGDSANELDVTINYDSGGLEDLEASGTISGDLQVAENFTSVSHNEAPSNLQDILDEMEANERGDGSQSNPYVILNDRELQAMNADKDAYYELGINIDASQTGEWNSGKGFDPIGSSSDHFSGELDGNGFEIKGLTVDRPSTNQVGLFGQIRGADVQNIEIKDAEIKGANYVGGVAGQQRGGTSIIRSVSFDGLVNGSGIAGGIVGYNYGASLGAPIVGSANVFRSENYGKVDGGNRVGGIAGYNRGTINNSLSRGSVNGSNEVGGAVGINYQGNMEYSYSATDSVKGSSNLGGLIGNMAGGSQTASYWNEELSGVSTSAGGSGRTTNQLQEASSGENVDGELVYDSWDSSVWEFNSPNEYPRTIN